MTMSADTLLSDTDLLDAGSENAPALQRTVGQARLAIRQRFGRSRLDRLYQQGAAKIRLPNVAAGALPEAVLINTAGGLTGGDRFSVDVDIGEDAGAVITSQACEKIYRSSGGVVSMHNSIRLGARSICAWLPQETILFDHARLERRLDIDMTGDARLLTVEPLILGRAAMGENVRSGLLHDRWRIRRDGRLLHAEDFRLQGNIGNLTAAAPLLAGNRAAATIILVCAEAEDHLGAVRGLIGGGDAGASAWDGRLVVRLMADSGQSLRAQLLPLVRLLLARLDPDNNNAAALPRVWTT